MESQFCGGCGARQGRDRRFCTRCGSPLDFGPPIDGEASPTAARGVPAADEQADRQRAEPASVPHKRIAPSFEIGEVARASLPPFAVWFVASLIFAVLLGGAATFAAREVTDSSGQLLFNSLLRNSFLPLLALAGAFLASLGASTTSNLSSGFGDLASGTAELSVVPLGALLVLAVAAAWGTRHLVRWNPDGPDPRLISLAIALVSTAAITACAYGLALVGTVTLSPDVPDAGGGLLGEVIGGLSPTGSLSVTPALLNAALFLFPALWIGSLVGTWRAGNPVVTGSTLWVPSYALRGVIAGCLAFFAGLALASAAVIVFGLVLLVVYREFAPVVLALLPALLAVAPNIGVLAIGASTGAYDSASGLPTPSWPVALAILGLTIVVPTAVAGLRLRASRAPFAAVPIVAATVGILVASIAEISVPAYGAYGTSVVGSQSAAGSFTVDALSLLLRVGLVSFAAASLGFVAAGYLGLEGQIRLRPRELAGTAGRRVAHADRRILAAAAAVLLLLAAGGVAFSMVNSPEARLSRAVETVAARQTTNELTDSVGFATATGMAYAPAGVQMDIRYWQVESGGNDTWTATWTLDARRDDAETSTEFNARFGRVGDGGFTWFVEGGYFDPSPFIPPMESREAAQAFVDGTNDANAAFGTVISLSEARVPDPEAAMPTPIATEDPTLLQGETVPIAAGSPAGIERLSVVIAGTAYPVFDTPIEAVPGRVRTGTLDPQGLLDAATAALAAVVEAKEAGDVAAALPHLRGAEGLTASGLAASGIEMVDASQMRVAGEQGDYYVTAGGMEIRPDAEGRWTIDYGGRPLVALQFSGALSYDGTCGTQFSLFGGCTSRDRDPSPVTITMEDAVLAAGQDSLVLNLVVDRAEGDRTYNDGIFVISLEVNGVPVPDFTVTRVCSLTPAEGDHSKVCPLPPILVPEDGLHSIEVAVDFGGHSYISDVYADGIFTAP